VTPADVAAWLDAAHLGSDVWIHPSTSPSAWSERLPMLHELTVEWNSIALIACGCLASLSLSFKLLTESSLKTALSSIKPLLCSTWADWDLWWSIHTWLLFYFWLRRWQPEQFHPLELGLQWLTIRFDRNQKCSSNLTARSLLIYRPTDTEFSGSHASQLLLICVTQSRLALDRVSFQG